MLVTPLHDRIGAEVTGLDLRRRPSKATVQALHDALHQHIVLVFRGCATPRPAHHAQPRRPPRPTP